MGLASGTSNDFPCAPPRCGGAPAAVRTHPEHAPDGPDTGGHRPGPPGRAPGAGAMGSPSTTTSQHHSRGCSKRQSVFQTTSSVVNRKRIKISFWENPSCNHENPACLRYGATNSSLLRWFSADVARNGWRFVRPHHENIREFREPETVHGRLVEVSAALALWFSASRASIEAPVGRPGRRRGRGARIWTRGPPSTSTPLLLVALAAARPTRGN